jgi:hypothetical protein
MGPAARCGSRAAADEMYARGTAVSKREERRPTGSVHLSPARLPQRVLALSLAP